MRRIIFLLLPFALFIALQPSRVLASEGYSKNIGRMSVQELRTLLGNEELQIIDVRDAMNWTFSRSKIPGAVRENPGDVDSWAGKYSKDRITILY